MRELFISISNKIRRSILWMFIILLGFSSAVLGQRAKHTFRLGETEFLLDDQPFQMISGEMHPARIPAEYWRHRVRMAKAMGCNTIGVYVFWNYHEQEGGVFDFSTGNRNLSEFFRIVRDEGMWLLLRPGPYVCAEWELGGIPPYLLRIPDIRLRCMDPRYMAAVERYMKNLAAEIKPWLITSGGPILMVQIENEYGSYGNDRNYMARLKDIWIENGINVPFFTGDGPTPYMLEAGTLPGCAVGLDPGNTHTHWELANRINPGVPVFSSEKWARPDTANLMREVRFLMDNRKSFNLYVIHGGTNFGFTAGANSGYKGYEPDVTSYDYDAPIDEQGRPTTKYMALRELIGSYLPKGKKLPSIPDPVPVIEIPAIGMGILTPLWDNLPEPLHSVQPLSFEAYAQDYGFILYKTELIGHKSGKLTVTNLHDYATVFLDGQYIGLLDRREGINTIDLPAGKSESPILEILVEAMGRINFGQNLIDRKGITERVTLNGMTLMNWQIYNLPMNNKFVYDLRSSAKVRNKPGIFFKGNFFIEKAGDTFFDVSLFRKGIVWVNGRNLGRYWDIGPQKRLYCPGIWLRQGLNEIIIFDMHLLDPKPVFGMKTME